MLSWYVTKCLPLQLISYKNGCIQAAENREMDSSQLYDAFQNILEIKMSQDEFQVYFKKVS